MEVFGILTVFTDFQILYFCISQFRNTLYIKKIALIALLLAAAFSGNATVYLDETFNYSTGATLATAAGWSVGGIVGTGVETIINETALSYQFSTKGFYILKMEMNNRTTISKILID